MRDQDTKSPPASCLFCISKAPQLLEVLESLESAKAKEIKESKDRKSRRRRISHRARRRNHDGMLAFAYRAEASPNFGNLGIFGPAKNQRNQRIQRFQKSTPANIAAFPKPEPRRYTGFCAPLRASRNFGNLRIFGSAKNQRNQRIQRFQPSRFVEPARTCDVDLPQARQFHIARSPMSDPVGTPGRNWTFPIRIS